MVGLIYIVSQKHFIPPKRTICGLSDYGEPAKLIKRNKYSEFDYVFEDWTGNFTDLLYWNTDIELNNRTLKIVLHKLSVTISRLKKENIEPKTCEPSFFLPDWWFGKKPSQDGCSTKNIPDRERKSVLLFHLLNMYDNLMEINKKNKTYYCYLC